MWDDYDVPRVLPTEYEIVELRLVAPRMKVAVSDLDEQLLANWDDSQLLIELGLPGCLAIGYVPGSTPGKLRPADEYHKLLTGLLLAKLREPEGRLH